VKILIIQTAFIGDVILTTPVLLELSRCRPEAEIHFLVRKGNEELLRNFPGVNQVMVWEKKKNKISNLLKLIGRIRQEHYDEVINLQRFASSGLLTILSGAHETTGFRKNPFSVFFSRRVEHRIGGSSPLHETERNLALIHHQGAGRSCKPALFPDAGDFNTTSIYKNRPYRCIAPASVWATKQVPVEKWIELIHYLSEKKPDDLIYLLGGPGDTASCELIRERSGQKNVISLAGGLSFLQTAALMKDAQMNFVNDSAPLHIASAMNAPVTAFFCSTSPDFGFGPLSTDRAVEEVQGLSCKPCGLHGHRSCPEKHFRCGFDLNMRKGSYLR